MTSKPSETLKQDLTKALETAGKSLLETAELFKRVGSLEITTTAEDAKRKRKQQKDPNAPKRPPGSFFLFANDRRAKLRADHPDKDTKEIAKLLGEEWATLNEKSKKGWIHKADVEKERYNKELEAYKAKHPSTDEKVVEKKEEEEEEDEEEKEEKKEEKTKEEAPKTKKRAKAQPKATAQPKAQPKAKAQAKATEEKPTASSEEPKKKRGRQSASTSESKESKASSKETPSKKSKTKKTA
ncbi:high mobility group box 3 [Umbelopsis nana]